MFVRLGLLLILCSSGRIFSDAFQTSPSPRFDIEDIYHNLSEPENVKRASSTPCEVTGPFAIAAALEIANFLKSGESVPFSVQEIVDCHLGGCNERHFSEYIEWLAVNDRLAPKDKYTGYRSMSYTCRAATSPDALTNIVVTGHKKIEPSEFESAITL